MKSTLFALALVLCSLSTPSFAGVFNIPQFVEYQNWAVGLEPEATLSSYGNTQKDGIALNAKFTYGITPLSNLQVGIGPGSGSKNFRLGATYTFDFIPDLEGQMGAGLAVQAYLYNLKNDVSQTETTLYPYIHKAFTSDGGIEYDPYLAMPYGMAFHSGNYRFIWQLVGGVFFKMSEHYGVNGEVGANLKDTDTYLSLGVTYRD